MRLLQISFALLLLAGGWNVGAQDSQDLVFVARRSGVAEVLDAATLDTLARIHVGFRVEHFSASADGSRLEIAGYAVGAGCCRHYVLDPATARLKEKGAASYTGDFGDCLISPDGHWCFQLKSFRGPALKMVNLEEPGSARVLVPPDLPEESPAGNWSAAGAWSGDGFYLYVQGPDSPGFLWNVRPGAETLGAAVKVAPFGGAPDCPTQRFPVAKSIVAAARNIFLYEPFGSKADRAGVRSGVAGRRMDARPGDGRTDEANCARVSVQQPDTGYNWIFALRSCAGQ